MLTKADSRSGQQKAQDRDTLVLYEPQSGSYNLGEVTLCVSQFLQIESRNNNSVLQVFVRIK